MARAHNVFQIPDEEPIAVVLELQEELQHTSERPRPSSIALTARNQFIKDIRTHIGNNRAIVVEGCCYSQCHGFSVEDIGMVRPFMSHDVYWQGICIPFVALQVIHTHLRCNGARKEFC